MQNAENQDFLNFLESEAVRHLVNDFNVELAQNYLVDMAICALESDHFVHKSNRHQRSEPLHELKVLLDLLVEIQEEVRPLVEQVSEKRLKRA
ncbi:MAG: hypothetical protein ACE362_19885 [Phaeodactylibacter xiamenensis]|uniref:HEPN domain-containing protein n=1 Tax=Phaeodactylibacter xiamenensis TaxID=1524460 RepID=A0A098S418_9BACT|nr:hypothetical protein [Phaeodactylibacter xiamenensis]KGE85927.1 hypothetical protein IX84_25315 [Phaeodactylibacter xiamenensis]MCR9051277.1 hypothetical protein [bacterium]